MLLFIVFPLEQLFSPVLFLEAGGFAIFFFTCTPRAVKEGVGLLFGGRIHECRSVVVERVQIVLAAHLILFAVFHLQHNCDALDYSRFRSRKIKISRSAASADRNMVL